MILLQSQAFLSMLSPVYKNCLFSAQNDLLEPDNFDT